jgi:hypothetical protein
MSGGVSVSLGLGRLAEAWARFIDHRRGLARCRLCGKTTHFERMQGWRYIAGSKGAGWVCPGCSPLAANHGGAQ